VASASRLRRTEELARLQKEVEALRLVAGMIGQESKAEINEPISLPAAPEILRLMQ
jgi:hypothetical protein